jgi:hypothetical protein
MVEWVLGPPAVLFGVVTGIYGVWGPIWPTSPIFSPGPPSYASPFGIPFTVTNRSLLFPISGLSIGCQLINVTTEHGIGFAGITMKGTGSNVLDSGQSRPYFCLFDQLVQGAGKIHTAEIAFSSEYDAPLLSGKNKTISGHFVLNSSSFPASWMQGMPLH